MKARTIIFYIIAFVSSNILMASQPVLHDTGQKHSDDKSTKNPAETVTDIDGNVYTTITIGKQTWMVENLKTTKYRNGDAIETTTPYNLNIKSVNEPRFQWAYNGKADNANVYGRLYTWYAANDPRGIAPEGWRVPTEEDFLTLVNYLIDNGNLYSFDKVRNSGSTAKNMVSKALSSTSGWFQTTIEGAPGNNPFINNASGFNAVPGGKRNADGAMVYGPGFAKGNLASFWTSSEVNTSNGNYRYQFFNVSTFSTRGAGEDKKTGMSIRCIKIKK
jgi:uncharacterized protein (TIGR02145 family)